jgi:hypothetical protein
MRIDAPAQPADAAASWERFLLGRLDAGGAPAWADEVAAGVAAWCREAVGPAAVREDEADAWLVHALCAVGAPDAARAAFPARRIPAPEGMGVPGLLLLWRGGVLGERRLDCRGGARVWCLDLGRLVRGAAAGGELAVYRVLRAALERIGSAWAAGAPVGSLALTGVGPVAERIEGARASAGRRRARARHLRRFAGAVLARRGLARVDVVQLDIG